MFHSFLSLVRCWWFCLHSSIMCQCINASLLRIRRD